LAQGYLKLQSPPNRLSTFAEGSLVVMVHPILSLSSRKGRWLNKRSPSGSGAQSRSTSSGSLPSQGTSSGSLPSDAQGSTETRKSSLSSVCSDDISLQKPSTRGYPGKMLGLPEYDYPTPWSIAEAPNSTGKEFPAPLVVKNTFINFDIGRPASLEEFFLERLTQSCPVSGVSMPPDSGNASAVPDVLHKDTGSLDMTEGQSTPSSMNDFTPVRMLDGISMNLETPRFFPPPPEKPPAFHMNYSSPVSPAPLHAPPVFDIDWQSPAAPAPLYAPAHAMTAINQPSHTQLQASMFNCDWQSPVPLSRHDTAPHTGVLDLLNAISATPEAVQDTQVLQHSQRQPRRFQKQTYMQQGYYDAIFNEQICTPGFCLPTHGAKEFTSPQEAQLVGSPECPTVGSQGHWSGFCKPCAFFHTKGCGNGINCVFCHLCEEGAKKKRAKEKRSERRFRPHSYVEREASMWKLLRRGNAM